MADIIESGPVVDQRVPENERLLKHIRRPDLFRLLKALGYSVTPDMTGTKLRELVRAHNIPVFKYMSKRLLRFNPRSQAVTQATRQYMAGEGTTPSNDFQPLEEKPGIHGDTPVEAPPTPKRSQAELDVIFGQVKPPALDDIQRVMTPVGYVDLEDLSQPALVRIAQQRDIVFKQPISKKKLIELLNQPSDSVAA